LRAAGLVSTVAIAVVYMAGLLVTVALAAPGCATTAPAAQPPQQKQLTQAVSPPERLRPAEPLSEIARALLRERMASHDRDMGELVSDIMVLRYERIQAGAQRIAGDANLGRPLSADASELNSALPEKFFLYQDDLRLEARTLAEAAARQHAFDVADSYGRLSQVCVRCHATYRAGR
jgi:cytochrome c556